MRARNFAILVALGAVAGVAAQADLQRKCFYLPSLVSAHVPNVQSPRSSFIDVHGMNVSGTWNSVPFCRLQGSIPYPNKNSVQFELWLPDNETYNGRYLSVGPSPLLKLSNLRPGNGGFAGTIDTSALLQNLQKGFAVAGGDGGHRQTTNDIDNGASYLPFLHDEQQTLAWIRNSIAYFTPSAKAITGLFYDHPPGYSYFEGCSTGGAQGFALAEFHPNLFDGIVASCPGNWYSHLMLSFLWGWRAAEQARLCQPTLDFIRSRALDSCDALDGLQDGIIENPLACRFNISTLACSPTFDSTTSTKETCLTPGQLKTHALISSGPAHPVSHKSLYPGFQPGSESDWTGQQDELAQSYAVPLLQNLFSQSERLKNFTLPTANAFNWTSDVSLVDSKISPVLDAISTDLSAFRNAGGKLLVTQGWSDPYNAPTWPMEHLVQIEEVTGSGKEGEEWTRLFMIPGGGHCGPSPHYPNVPYEANTLETMVNWVEKGTVPREMRASKTANGSSRTRKLCAWPLVARYTGDKTEDDWSWEKFECVEQ